MAAPFELAQRPSWQMWLCGLLPVAALLPFLAKPYHIDDPVYVWVAQHIAAHPADFFGFKINWGYQPEWVHDFNKNPPGLSYYLAPFGVLFGWSEVVLHTAMLLPTFLASLAVFKLAQRFCDRPLLASLIALLSPVYFISNSNVMCEPLMLATYLWGVYLWVRGLDLHSPKRLAAAAFILGIGIVVKYIVITALPLLAAWTILKRGRRAYAIAWFLLPLGMVTAYDLYTLVQYDKSIIRDAIEYSSMVSSQSTARSTGMQLMMNLSFTGGCFLTAALFLPMLARDNTIVAHIVVFALVVGMFFFRLWTDRPDLAHTESDYRWLYVLQTALFVTGGIFVLVLAVNDLWNERNADSALLFLWIFGVFVFSGYVNWTINGRALLPIAGAVGILVARQASRLPDARKRLRAAPVAIAIGGAVSLAVCHADYAYAVAARDAVNRIVEKTAGHRVVFQGHSGFQYYMEQAGHQAFDINLVRVADTARVMGSMLRSDAITLYQFNDGDYAAKPPWGDSVPGQLAYYTSTEWFDEPEVFSPAAAPWVTTFHEGHGAGFYSHHIGPLPYYFGRIEPQPYYLYRYRMTRTP